MHTMYYLSIVTYPAERIEYTGLSFAILISAQAAGKPRADPLSLASSAVIVLCLNMDRTSTRGAKQ